MPRTEVESKFGRVWDVPIEVTVEVARTNAPLGDTLSLRPGSIVPLDRLATEPVEVRAGNRVLAYGELVVIDEEFGVRITDMAEGAAPRDAAGEPADVFEPQAGESADALARLATWQAARDGA